MTTATAPSLDRPIVVYDGSCPFCQRQVAKMRKRDVQQVFEYTPRQDPQIEQRIPALTHGDFNTGMRLVHTDGHISVGADAVYEIARRLPGWRAMAWLYRVPGLQWFFKMGYAWIAKNRYKLAEKQQSCENDQCRL